MRRIDAAAAALLVLCIACLWARLAAVPAMSLDEAWIGLYAARLRNLGFYTPHAMNHYTGPLFGALVAACIGLKGMTLEALRLPGAVLNTAALAGLWLHLRRRVSPEAGAAWLLLAAGSAYLLLKSRLGWEVYALQPLLILGTFSALASPAGGPALAALTVVGTSNHFIFLSIPVSLVLLFGARAAWRGETQAEPKLRDAAAALAAGLAFAFIKHPITEEGWVAHRGAFGFALLAGPAAAAFAVSRLPAGRLTSLFARWRREFSVLCALALVAFAVWHVPPIVELFAGPVVFQRLFSYDLVFPVTALLHLWGLFLAGALVWYCINAWHDETLGFHERTLRLWPAAFAVAFVAFRHTSSLRYYSLPFLLCLTALATILPRLARADKRGVYACAALAALLTQGLMWQEIASPGDRKPIRFHVGWRHENSKDFSRKEALFAAYDASGACQVGHPENSFTSIPLTFYRSGFPGPACDPKLAFDADQCPECPAPPYYRWAVVPAR